MAKNTAIRNPDELEQLRRRIFVYRQRGLTLKQIAEAPGIDLTPSTVHYHLKKTREKEYEKFDMVGQAEVVGEVLLHLRELYQEAARNMANAEMGTLLRMTMLDLTGRRYDKMVKFMQDTGIIQKAADRVDMTVRDMRNMSTEEIARDIRQLQRELAHAPNDFIDAKKVKQLPLAAEESLEVTPEH